jgi:NADH:ubiquinone reductase (H+-translocating)
MENTDKHSLNIPETKQTRTVILGAGFAGVAIARKLAKTDTQVVLIDKNNYHQFQPLFYQVAMAGLEPSSIVFPLRKIFQGRQNVFVRMAEMQTIDTVSKLVTTSEGQIHYDQLIIAIGADTNWYANEQIRSNAIPMKSVSEALYLRNAVFKDYELAVSTTDFTTRQTLLDIVIVGGGPTGVEIAGSLAEMKKYIVPKDYHDLDGSEIELHLVHGGDRLLNTMSAEASEKAEQFLRGLGVKLYLDTVVKAYDGLTVTLDNGNTLTAKKVIWAAGITGNPLPGIPSECLTKGGRIKVNDVNQVVGLEHVFAVGDIAFQTETAFPDGHPQVAQVALQQGALLAANLIKMRQNKPLKPFTYKDLGSMATIGRHRAVVDLPFWKFQGSFAWFAWLFVHLFAIIGVKNKIFVFLNWVFNYFTYDQSLRLVIKPWTRMETKPDSSRADLN